MDKIIIFNKSRYLQTNLVLQHRFIGITGGHFEVWNMTKNRDDNKIKNKTKKTQTFKKIKRRISISCYKIELKKCNVIYLPLFYLWINIELTPSNYNINKSVLHP